MNTDSPIFLGIDVGTGSARAGFFSVEGHLLAQSSCPIKIWYPQDAFVEQSSTNIWHAVCQATKTAYATLPPQPIAGIGFDATCSLVVVNAKGEPLSVSPPATQHRHGTSQETPAEIPNVIVWMDHRALAETEEINAQKFSALDYIGGRMSLEMQTPKLLWLRRHRADTWQKATHFFDLPDFLTWKATGKTTRSLCSTTCKWTYLGHKQMWDAAYFRAIGLGDIVEEKFLRIGQHILPPGAPVGLLSTEAARELGLPANIPVSASAIDAHAGGIGTIGAMAGSDNLTKTSSSQASMTVPDIFSHRIALIAGTSSCHMAISPQPRFVPGVWGPYYGAMLPDMWLNEGGQSATGSLIDHIISTHHAYSLLKEKATQQGITPYDYLNTQIGHLSSSLPSYSYLTEKLHILPDFHGNRSPLADPAFRGMISGLSLHSGLDELTLLYLATLQGLAYGTRQIIETLNEKGYRIDTVMVSGGQTKNPLFLQEHANATQCRIVLPKEQEAVLLGSAILGAVAGGVYPSIPAAMAAMSHIGHVIEPGEPPLLHYHTRKYSVFLQMQKNQYEYNALMNSQSS